MSTPNDDNASISEKKEDTPSMSKDPAEPKNSTRVEFVLTPEERKREWIQIAALSWALFFVGWVDGTTGPLLPSFQRYWHVNDTVVSLLFILNCVVSAHFYRRWGDIHEVGDIREFYVVLHS